MSSEIWLTRQTRKHYCLSARKLFLQCHTKFSIRNGEYGLAKSIIRANFTMDTLLYKFQGVNWRDTYVYLRNVPHYSRVGVNVPRKV